jgi:hypothetical protein
MSFHLEDILEAPDESEIEADWQESPNGWEPALEK